MLFHRLHVGQTYPGQGVSQEANVKRLYSPMSQGA